MEEPKNEIKEIKDDREKNPDIQAEENENDKENIAKMVDEKSQNPEEQKQKQEAKEDKEEKNENPNEEVEKKTEKQNQEEPPNENKIIENKEKDKEQEKDLKDNEKKEMKEKDKKILEIHKKQKEIKEKKERKEVVYVYFIENHLESKDVEIQLAESAFTSDLEIKFQDKFSSGENTFNYSIYRFKISNLKSENKIVAIIKLKDKEKNKNFESKIDIDDFTKDIFLYDIEFKSNKIMKSKASFYFNFSHQEQFEFYIHLLRKILNLNQRTNENEDLILSTHKMLDKYGKKYPFSFYLIIFLECFSCAVTYNHLMEFKYNKIDKPENLNPIKVKQINNILKLLGNHPEKVLDYIKEEENKKKCRIKLYSIILYLIIFSISLN